MQKPFIGLSLTGITLLSAIANAQAPVQAQVLTDILPDTTLGNENSQLTPTVDTTQITGGATRGPNLFHSFSQFSIGTNQTAWFDNALSIQNILVRVTGPTRSDIDGTLRTNGTADLFLINPNGFIFGPNAKLNIGGALSVLTTPAIPLGTQGTFNASAPAQSQLLAIKPSALFDLASLQPQNNIAFNANWATQGQSITFVAKNIEMAGRLTNATPFGPSTLTLRSSDNITLTQTQINNPSGNELYVPEPGFAPIRLMLDADADRSGQGDITIQDADIGLYGGLFQATAPGKILLARSRLLSQSFVNQPVAEPISFQAGAVELKGKPLKGLVRGGNYENPTGREDASAITIATDQTIQQSNSPLVPINIMIQSNQPIVIEHTRINQPRYNAKGEGEPKFWPATFAPTNLAAQRSNLYPTRLTLNSNQAITIKSSKIGQRSGRFQAQTPGAFLLEEAEVYSDNYTNQAAEPIVVQAGTIRLKGTGKGMSGNAIAGGRAADIQLLASDTITLEKAAGIGSNTVSSGDAGNLILKADNQIEVKDGGFGNQSGSSDLKNNNQITGKNGDVIFTAKNIIVNNFGVNVDHFGQGGGGKIVLNAQENITIGIGGFSSNGKGSAQGADIMLKAGKQINMNQRSGIITTAQNDASGGNIRIETPQFLLRGSISTTTKGKGTAGNITITSPQISLEQETFIPNSKRPTVTEIARGTISSYTGTPKEDNSAPAAGKAGDITLNSTGPDSRINLASGAGIANTSFADSTGNTGNIVLRSSRLDVQQGSQILIATNGNGNTGLIDIDTTKAIQLTGTSDDGKAPSSILSAIGAKATGTNSQDIKIKSPSLAIDQGSGIIASSLGDGNSGNIKIDVGTLSLAGTNAKLTSGVLTSVGISNLPDAGKNQGKTQRLIAEVAVPGSTVATLQPINSPGLSNANARGNSGNITLELGNLDISQDAQLTTVILGSGRAGNISIQSKGNIRLLDRGAIRADSGSGQGGSIDITSQRVLLLRRGGEISAVSRANGQDGNIKISTPFIVGILNENSDIFAVSQEALNGGRSVGNNLTINAQGILGFAYQTQFTPKNDIIATGNVTLNLPDIDPSRGLTVLPIAPIDVTQKIDRTCNPNAASQSSSFTTRGNGGLPATPTTAIVPDPNLVRLAQLPPDSAAQSTMPAVSLANLPREAQTAMRLADGRIRFQSNNQEAPLSQDRSNCLN
jgi:filamentous hemagglutinin family protein